MAEKKLIHVLVTNDRFKYQRIAIPANINEVELKDTFRKLGYIPFNMDSYRTTKVYLDLEDGTDNSLKEICTDEYRSLEDLGIVEGSLIFIKKGKPEPKETRVIYRERGSMRCLYGCPTAQSVEKARNQAERHSDNDSSVMTGSIGTD